MLILHFALLEHGKTWNQPTQFILLIIVLVGVYSIYVVSSSCFIYTPVCIKTIMHWVGLSCKVLSVSLLVIVSVQLELLSWICLIGVPVDFRLVITIAAL